MGWFADSPSAPTSAEADILWNAETLDADENAPVLSLVEGLRISGAGIFFMGRITHGTLYEGQSVAVQGRAGYARAELEAICYGADDVPKATAGQFVTVQVRNMSLRPEILDLDRGCTIVGL